MKSNSGDKETNRVATAVIITSAVFLGIAFFIYNVTEGAALSKNFIGLSLFFILFVLILAYRFALGLSSLVFIIPFILILIYLLLNVAGSFISSILLIACVNFSGIIYLFSNYRKTIQMVILNFLILAAIWVSLTLLDIEHEISFTFLIFTCVVSMLCVVVIHKLAKATSAAHYESFEDQKSFHNLLSTTANYFAMIDESNRVIYISKSLSLLVKIEEPELARKRYFIDLFQGRDIKILVGKTLEHKENFEGDWEFTLDGQKRFFRVASSSLPGSTRSFFINLQDLTYLAERDEIAAMKDSMKIGLFFMDKNYVIQDLYSRYLEEMLSESDLHGKLFTDIIADSVTENELNSVKDYIGMIVERSIDQEMLEEINPLSELRYVNTRTDDKKIFQFSFATVERGHGEIFVLVTVYDITVRIELQQRLADEEARRQEEMQSVFELIQVEPDVFSDFTEDMEEEFEVINKTHKNEDISTHDALVKIYQSVHAIKSNAVILGLNVFGNKLHALESKIKKLREMKKDVPFTEMLNLTMDIEKISEERDRFKDIISKIKSYGKVETGERQNVRVMLDSLAKCAARAGEDMKKQIKFISNDIDDVAINRGPRRVMKEILMQLIRNSAAHGIEIPEVRKEKGKPETGIIKLSIKVTEDYQNIQIRLSDDGRGLDYSKIAERAITNNLIKEADAKNEDVLKRAIFMPGFSTAETEGLHAGRGIGLNLVRDRVKEVGGMIKLNSSTDKGMMFFISIPLPKHRKRRTDS